MASTQFMGALGNRWERRRERERDGREPLTVTSVVAITATEQAVWDFLDDPGTALLLDPWHLATVPVPGAPEHGVGHLECHVRRGPSGDLSVSVAEIMDEEPPNRLVQRASDNRMPFTATHTISATAEGCTYALDMDMRVSLGSSRRVAPALQTLLDDHTSKVKAFVERGARLAAQSPDGPPPSPSPADG